MADASRVHVLFDEVLGEVRYGKLSKADFDLLQCEADEVRRAYKMVFQMLRRGYPDLTEEEFERLPFDVVARLSEAFAKQVTGFLRPDRKSSTSGLKPALKPKQ